MSSEISLLQDACESNNVDNVRKLLTTENIKCTNGSGASLVHLSAMHGSLRVLNYLIKNGAKLDMVDKYGQQPLHVAGKVFDV